jgi:hypothetical protein
MACSINEDYTNRAEAKQVVKKIIWTEINTVLILKHSVVQNLRCCQRRFLERCLFPRAVSPVLLGTGNSEHTTTDATKAASSSSPSLPPAGSILEGVR